MSWSKPPEDFVCAWGKSQIRELGRPPQNPPARLRYAGALFCETMVLTLAQDGVTRLMETTAKCAYCGAATELFNAGVPISSKCDDAREKVSPPPGSLEPTQERTPEEEGSEA